MADPDDRRPLDPPRNGRLAADTPPEGPHKGVFPLLWLTVLIALLAFGWSLYNRHASRISPAPTLPVNTSPTSPPPPQPRP